MDGIDTKTAVGRMVFSMVGAISEFELNVISERTRAGMAAARRRGRHAAVCRNSPDQLDYARRMIGERIGRVQAARSLGVDRPTLGGC
jgi:DNA invertase Pin-like site-specific DNA recombinase